MNRDSTLVCSVRGGVGHRSRCAIEAMPTLVLTVEDAFDIAERGIVVTGNIPGEWVHDRVFFVRDGETVSLIRPDGTSVVAVVRGIDLFTLPLGTPYGEIPMQRSIGILLGDVAKDQVPLGTKVFTEIAAP
jgi:translation elongation factor EF-Tu-like GTPase